GLAACNALAGSAGWEPSHGFLKGLTDEQFRAFAVELHQFKSREAVFARLRSDSDLADTLVNRLFETRPQVTAAWLEAMLAAVGCAGPAWHGYWLKKRGRQLAALLESPASGSELSRRLGNGLIAQITVDNYDEPASAENLETLVAAGKRFPELLAEEQRARIEGWYALSTHFASPPKSPPTGTAHALPPACAAVGQTPEALGERWFRKWVVTESDELKRKRKAEALGRAILGFHESEDEACGAALKLAGTEPNLKRQHEYQTDLFTSIVSKD